MCDIEIYRVESLMQDQMILSRVEDIGSLAEITPGSYVIKQAGSWIDLVAVKVIGPVLREQIGEYVPLIPKER